MCLLEVGGEQQVMMIQLLLFGESCVCLLSNEECISSFCLILLNVWLVRRVMLFQALCGWNGSAYTLEKNTTRRTQRGCVQ